MPVGGRWRHGGAGRLAAAVATGLVLASVAVALGFHLRRPVETLSLMGTSVVLEAQPAAAAAVALGYPPAQGAAISLLANLAPLPIIVVGLDYIMRRWAWARRQIRGAQKRTERFSRYGPWVFLPIGPFIGAYAATAVGRSLGFKTWNTFWATLAGMLWSVSAITYGGHWVIHLFVH